MTTTSLRVAVGLIRSADPQHRWRLVALLAGSAVLALGLLVAASTLVLAQRQDLRELARTPHLSQTPASTDVFTRAAGDRWRDRVITVVWLEPASPHAHYPAGVGLAAGMRELPRPGCSVVSPGLARLIDAQPRLAARYPCRSVLADSGVRDDAELIAFSRPRDARGLGDITTAIRVEDGRLEGTGPVVRNARIGLPPEPDRIRWWQLALGLTGVVLVPAAVVAVVSISAASPLRERRIRLLQALGAPAAMVRWITAWEVLLLAIPASLVAAVTWCLATRLGVGRPLAVLDGDLDLSAPVAGAVAVLSIVLSVVLALLAQGTRRGRGAPPLLSRADLVPLSRLAVVPMLVAAALFGLSGVLGGADGRALRMLGAVVAVAGTPLLIPLTARRLGASLGASRRPSAWLAGRALVWAPRRHVRPFIGLGTLVALLFLGVGYLSAIRHTEDPPAVSSARVAAVGVSWRGGAETALDGLTRGVPHGLAVAVSADDHHQSGADHGVSHGESEEVAGDDAIRLAATCPELAATGLRLRCHAADPHRISATESRALGLLIGRTFSDEPAPVRLVSRAGLGEPVTRAVVLGTVPTRELDERVRASANAVLSAPSVTSVENNRPVHTRAATWIGGGFAAAGTLLSIAALIAIVDRLLGSRRSWRQLLNIGLTRRGLARLDLQLLVQPWLAAVGTGSAVGSVAALALGDPGQGYPWGGAVLVVAGVALLTVLAGVLAFALAQRAALPERE